jgi:glycosyltransferase involved in cell wall biosynthesis
MKRVALLTAVDFWRVGAGHRARIRALAAALCAEVELTLVLPTAASPAVRAAIAALLPRARLHTLDLPPSGQRRDALAALAAFFRAVPQQACIVEYLSLGWLRAAIPPGVLTLVDTHDVVHRRDAELVALGERLDRPLLTAAEEAARLRAFDAVIAISEPDAEVFRSWLGEARVILAPHAQPLRPAPWREPLRRLLFVASGYRPNAVALGRFLHEAWPRLAARGLQLDVVGQVGPVMRLPPLPGVQVHGVVDDLDAAYDAADLALNPVAHGSGLKIKTVEALAHGLALVATPHAVRGLEAGAGSAFALAEDPLEMAAAIEVLAEDPAQRRRLAEGGLRLAAERFSVEACYGPLLAAL